MSDEKPSPGPWYSHVDAADDLELRSPDGTIIAVWYPSQHISKANFELLMAAPEMAELLREDARNEPTVMDECGMLPPEQWCYACRRRALLARLGG